ncbi:VWA domain-containing protein [Leucobacter muris]|uniref:VWA domain-containing protein n=1 Tax=Leucobacter muris TaxID=1935379 RepID=A0ABX5QFF2_9MICO|nr:vWA domain-containing protein [Leucobacter muris]QAB17755.1 VWA domain-containing protein [Leucobacter muris]
MVDRGIEERERLRAVGALIGVPVSVTDDDDWELDEAGLRVGLGWYAQRGHGRDEAVALALLQLWESVRGERVTPERARRGRSIVSGRPAAQPLVAAVVRLQAAAELLTALPGMRDRLASAMARSLPEGLGEQARHLQWVALLLAAGFGAPAPTDGADAEVAAEWDALQRASERGDALQRVLAPDPGRGALDRFERALALLLPPYERLLARDARDRGWGEAPRGAEAQEHEGGGASDDFGAAGAGGDAAQQAPDEGGQDGEASAPEDDERARAGEGRQTAEGADLFAAEQAGFVSALLATPLPAEGALLEAMSLPPLEGAPRSSDDPREAGGGAAAANGGLAFSDYRGRAGELADAIERMRAVWARVIAERVAQVRGIGRRPVPEGEMLSPEALARAVAEARAGVARPAAFLRRETRPRRRRRAGSTDYVLLVDRSASMQGRIADAAADAALIMMEALAGVERDVAHAEQRAGIELDLDIRTALVLFDAEPLVVKPLSRGLDDEARRRMDSGIRSPRGSTNDGAALLTAAQQLGIAPGAAGASAAAAADGVERRRLVLLVSDGGSNDPVAAARELRRLRAAGVDVHGIGIGSDEIVRRYAPSSRRVDDPSGIAEAILDLVESELP